VFLSGSVDHNGVERSDYMNSRNCLRELRKAVALALPLVVVLETDKMHGGVSIETHISQCPEDLRPAVFPLQQKKATQLLMQDGEGAMPPINWYRVRAFQDVSLRMVLERMVESWRSAPADTLAASLPVALPFEWGARDNDHIVIPRDITNHDAPALDQSAQFHIYVSPHNEGATGLVALLTDFMRRRQAMAHDRKGSIAVEDVVGRATSQIRRRLAMRCAAGRSQRPAGRPAGSSIAGRARRRLSLQPKSPDSLRTTSDPAQANAAEHVLLYLSGDTHTGHASNALHAELLRLFQRQPDVHVILAWEQRNGAPTASFEEIFMNTPQLLIELGIYSEIAIPLLDGPHQQASLHMLLQAIAAPPRRAKARQTVNHRTAETCRHSSQSSLNARASQSGCTRLSGVVAPTRMTGRKDRCCLAEIHPWSVAEEPAPFGVSRAPSHGKSRAVQFRLAANRAKRGGKNLAKQDSLWGEQLELEVPEDRMTKEGPPTMRGERATRARLAESPPLSSGRSAEWHAERERCSEHSQCSAAVAYGGDAHLYAARASDITRSGRRSFVAGITTVQHL